MSLTNGTRLGPYEILAPLGAGGMGEVYKARDTRLGRDVAVKVITERLGDDASALSRFEREAKAVAALSHPNILAIFDFGQEGTVNYAVMEFLEGETLRQRLRCGSIPVEKAVDIGLQIAHGLAAAHEKGIVHRDLKPENVFLTKNGGVKILDFGLAKLTHPEESGEGSQVPTGSLQTEAGAVLGTVGYMSPEQVRGVPADARSDIFSFGVVLYEMLSGRRPFEHASAMDTLAAILKEDPPELSRMDATLPPTLVRIVNHCLEKSPDARFQSVRDIAFDLELLITPSGAVPLGLDRPAGRKSPRRPMVLVAASSAIALTLGALVLGILMGKSGAEKKDPTFKRLTFGRGFVSSARFAPDGQTIAYAAAWSGRPLEIFTTRADNQGFRSLGLRSANLLSVSPSGEMAVCLKAQFDSLLDISGTLATVALAGGTPRELAGQISSADFSPDGKALAAVSKSGGTVRLEFPPGKVLCQTPRAIYSPRMSPRGDAVAFLDASMAADDGAVALVDLAGKKKALTGHWQSLTGLAWSPSGNEVWFSGTEVGSSCLLYAVTPSGRLRLVYRAPGRLALYDIAKDGRVLMARHHGCYRMVVQPHEDKAEIEIATLDAPVPKDISTDGQMVLSVETGEGAGEEYRTYLARADGSPPVRLGDGNAMNLSADGKWALALRRSSPPDLVLLPTGPGSPKHLPCKGVSYCYAARLLPSGEQIVMLGSEGGEGLRRYLLDVATGATHPVSASGVANWIGAASPDGRFLAAQDEQGMPVLYSLRGEAPRPISGLRPGLRPLRWSQDGQALFVGEILGSKFRVSRLDLRSGRLELWKELAPSDPAGVVQIRYCQITPDGLNILYGYSSTLSELYLVEGLK